MNSSQRLCKNVVNKTQEKRVRLSNKRWKNCNFVPKSLLYFFYALSPEEKLSGKFQHNPGITPQSRTKKEQSFHNPEGQTSCIRIHIFEALFVTAKLMRKHSYLIEGFSTKLLSKSINACYEDKAMI